MKRLAEFPRIAHSGLWGWLGTDVELPDLSIGHFVDCGNVIRFHTHDGEYMGPQHWQDGDLFIHLNEEWLGALLLRALNGEEVSDG